MHREIPYFWNLVNIRILILAKEIFNEPVQNISYYEAKYCNFRNYR